MKLPDISEVKTADEARDLALDWQIWMGEHDSSYGELISYQEYFEALAEKFPELMDEFKENAII